MTRELKTETIVIVISTKLQIHLQPMNVRGRYCLSFDDFEC